MSSPGNSAQAVADEALERGILKERIIIAPSVSAKIEDGVLILGFSDSSEIKLGEPPAPVRPAQDISDADIARRFTYHRPEGDKVGWHEDVRRHFLKWALHLAGDLPAGREKSLAFTALEEASFWAHAAIAREGK